MQRVFVLDTDKKPLTPTRPKRARQLLKEGMAAVFRIFPFTIILKKSYSDVNIKPVRLKIDPGSRTTGIALIDDSTNIAVFAAELIHRGQWIHELLNKRRGVRRIRRNRNTRYRQARFLNRYTPKGWLPPSLESRLHNITTWVRRLQKLVNLQVISQELVKFDMQKMNNSKISGIEYQQGELQGYEVREYLLEKWGRQCSYCMAKNLPLQIEHIIPKSRGGSNKISNLTLACKKCNKKKGTKTAEEFGFPNIQKTANISLRDASVVNITRLELLKRLQAFSLPVEIGTGAMTKYNRIKQGYEKQHWIDAACVGVSGEQVYLDVKIKPLMITAQGWGSRQMCRVDKYGFPRTRSKGCKIINGFQTGDMVKVVLPCGKNRGTYFGKVSVRTSGRFNITHKKIIQSIGHKHCKLVQRSDGYKYTI